MATSLFSILLILFVNGARRRKGDELCGTVPNSGCCWYNDDEISYSPLDPCNSYQTNTEQCTNNGGFPVMSRGYIKQLCRSGERILCCEYPK